MEQEASAHTKRKLTMYSDYEGIDLPGDQVCDLISKLQAIVERMEPSDERDSLWQAIMTLSNHFCEGIPA